MFDARRISTKKKPSYFSQHSKFFSCRFTHTRYMSKWETSSVASGQSIFFFFLFETEELHATGWQCGAVQENARRVKWCESVKYYVALAHADTNTGEKKLVFSWCFITMYGRCSFRLHINHDTTTRTDRSLTVTNVDGERVRATKLFCSRGSVLQPVFVSVLNHCMFAFAFAFAFVLLVF